MPAPGFLIARVGMGRCGALSISRKAVSRENARAAILMTAIRRTQLGTGHEASTNWATSHVQMAGATAPMRADVDGINFPAWFGALVASGSVGDGVGSAAGLAIPRGRLVE